MIFAFKESEMMRAVVIYWSKTGFVKKYAKWIAEELSIDARPGDMIDVSDLKEYDTIIFGGGLYAGGINGSKFMKKAIHEYKDKRFVIYSTGASPGRKEEIGEVWKRAFTDEEREKTHLFYLRGGFDYDKLGMKDKVLMKLLKKKLESKKERTEDEQGMLDAYERPVDFTDKGLIKPILELVRGDQ